MERKRCAGAGIEVVTPAGFVLHFKEIAPLLSIAKEGPLSYGALSAVMPRYRLEIDFGSIPVLVECHGLVSEEPTPPGLKYAIHPFRRR